MCIRDRGLSLTRPLLLIIENVYKSSDTHGIGIYLHMYICVYTHVHIAT